MSHDEIALDNKNDHNKAVDQHRQMVASIDYDNLFDVDIYPSDYCLDLIKDWHWTDQKAWFEFIRDVWDLSGGWSEQEVHEHPQKPTCRYTISTGGWSGNESIIKAMEMAPMLWYLTWVQSNRGGLYIFELREIDDE